MAKQTVIQMTDDLDGSEATQSIEFSVRGKSYTIDLNDSNTSDFTTPPPRTLRPRRNPVARSLHETVHVGRARRGSRGPVTLTRSRSGRGRRRTAWPSPPAAGSEPTSSSSTGPPTPDRSRRHKAAAALVCRPLLSLSSTTSWSQGSMSEIRHRPTMLTHPPGAPLGRARRARGAPGG